MAWPRPRRRSSATDFLLRDCTCHQTEVPSLIRRQLRSGRRCPRPRSSRRRRQTRQRLAAERPGDELAHLDHAHAGQGRGRGALLVCMLCLPENPARIMHASACQGKTLARRLPSQTGMAGAGRSTIASHEARSALLRLFVAVMEDGAIARCRRAIDILRRRPPTATWPSWRPAAWSCSRAQQPRRQAHGRNLRAFEPGARRA